MSIIPASELIINSDGSVFHLHLRPEQLADTVLLVGDPERSDMIARYFDRTECSVISREFHCHTGWIGQSHLTVVSTGIGCDNIDIVVTELDALANIDFATRTIRPTHRSLRLIRLGTSGAMQPSIEIGQMVASTISGGIDGLLNFYAGRQNIVDHDIERAFIEQTEWSPLLARPYFVHNDPDLLDLFSDVTIGGVTLSAPGFYGPQGRVVRLGLATDDYLRRIEAFEYNGLRITNFEMEGSAIAALASLLGHKSLTICTIIAQRTAGNSKPDYESMTKKMVEIALEKVVK